MSPSRPSDHVEAARAALNARAAGLWRVESDHLVQVTFVPSPDLPAEVAETFAGATRSVPLTQADLGIVRAATRGTVAVSIAAELPPDSGSGRWLRAFGAARSVAVPLLDDRGTVRAVISVALPDDPRAAADIAAVVCKQGRQAVSSMG